MHHFTTTLLNHILNEITRFLLNNWFKDRKWFVAHTIVQYLFRNTQYLVANPFALVTSFALLGMDATNVRTVSFGILSYSSLAATCRSATVCGDGFLELIALLRAIQRFSIGLRSGLWAGHSKHFTFLLVFQEVSSCKIVSKHRRCLSPTSGK